MRRFGPPQRYNPVLHPNIVAGVRVWPADGVARSKDSWRAGFEIFIHADAAFHGESGALSKREIGTNADSEDEEVGFDCASATQDGLMAYGARHGFAEIKGNAVRFMKFANEFADLGAEDTFRG